MFLWQGEPANTFLGCYIRETEVRIWLPGPIENVTKTSDFIRLPTSGFIVKTGVVSVYLQNPQIKFQILILITMTHMENDPWIYDFPHRLKPPLEGFPSWPSLITEG